MTHQSKINIPRKTQDDLEWQRLLGYLAGFASNEPAHDRLLSLPFLSAKEARRHAQLVAEFTRCIQDGDAPPRLDAAPFDEVLTRVRSEGGITAESLRNLAVNLKSFVAISRYLENRRDTCPLNAQIVVPEKDNPVAMAMARLAAEIESSFEADGTISDNASAELGKLRRSVISLRGRLLSSLEKLAEKEADLLRDRTVTLRNNRYVLPVRADAHRPVEGIVHGTSSSGATIFVEPGSFVSMGNDLMLAREAVHREEARILEELAAAVRDQLPDVESSLSQVIETEMRIAAARFSDKLHCSVPAESKPGAMKLIDARHPLLLLDGVDVVPSAIQIEQGKTMVISGPNAGGKTVVLKTVGLIGLMSAAGLPVPVDPTSVVGIPEQVLSDIGDEQSLEKSLSTFSAHMSNIASILEQSTNGAIVLLDELAAGTDPAEGAALAIALLEQLDRFGATTLVTSHFETLKNHAQSTEGFVNAAVGYDYDEMQPTFELQTGIPGSSSALGVAARYGISKSVIKNAEKYLPENLRELRTAVEALEVEKKRLSLDRQALGEERAAAEKAKKKYVGDLQKLKAKQDRFVDKETEQLLAAIKAARTKVRDAEQSLRRSRKDPKVVSGARKIVSEIADTLDNGGALSRVKADDLPGVKATADSLLPGTDVYIISLKTNGTVEEKPRGKKVFVRAGILRTQLSIDDLRVLKNQGPKAKPKPKFKTPMTPDAGESQAELRTSDNTLDLRGMRADEALDATDAFLDKAISRALPYAFVIHGHGTGALRDSVRAYLKDSPYAETYRPGKQEEGGDGITVVTLR